ncbi:hypothetical protein HanPSC8_Chr06g0235721 [Helianthus annuus]|nr:hypothetical protein HanPSC8_Chr06g0235721 [Helianthus annuus]
MNKSLMDLGWFKSRQFVLGFWIMPRLLLVICKFFRLLLVLVICNFLVITCKL